MTQFVVVGNEKEAQEFREKHKNEKGIFTVSYPNALKGKMIGPKDTVTFYGTAMQRKDIHTIMKMLEKCKRNS